MQAKDIRPGDVLKLKRERQEAYGLTYSHVLVESIKQRPGYAVPWIVTTIGSMRPSDFKCSLAVERSGLASQIAKAVTRG